MGSEKKERELIGYDKDSDKEYSLNTYERDREIVRGLRANHYPAGTLSDEEVDEIEEVLINYVVDNSIYY